MDVDPYYVPPFSSLKAYLLRSRRFNERPKRGNKTLNYKNY
jgi:hypothetical protein